MDGFWAQVRPFSSQHDVVIPHQSPSFVVIDVEAFKRHGLAPHFNDLPVRGRPINNMLKVFSIYTCNSLPISSEC